MSDTPVDSNSMPRSRQDVAFKPLRITGLVVGAGVMTLSLFVWFAYLGTSLDGFDPADSRPQLTSRRLVETLYLLWIVSWLLGLGMVLAAISGWLRRTKWTLLGLTASMLTLTYIIYMIGSS